MRGWVDFKRPALVLLAMIPLFGFCYLMDARFGEDLTATERFNRSCKGDAMVDVQYRNPALGPSTAMIRCERSDGSAYFLFRRTP